MAQNFVKHIIGDGQGTFLWLNNWHPSGLLYKLFYARLISILGRSISATVSTVIQNGEWHWPKLQNSVIHQIQHSIPSSVVPQSDKADEVVWTVSPAGQYTTEHTWEAIRNKGEETQWATVVWCIWEPILLRFQIQRRAYTWDLELNDAYGFCRSKTFSSLMFKLALAARLYFIWLERNSKIFEGRPRNSSVVLACIDDNIRLRVCIWNQFPNSLENQRLCVH
ncbi:uncharacterized protein LOC131323619 [Rhododendron vialii]|uniref:uncharacterized protein LOC131323619 n=1 Tax=Rhododendron vialii TaxID=182163 RepID=UPI00265F4D68|nr:uncharacterized protein LOC131323619 [Rhododendron vialii]